MSQFGMQMPGARAKRTAMRWARSNDAPRPIFSAVARPVSWIFSNR